MVERVLPLRGIAVFEAAARSSSFQSAADELNLSPSAVSHQIRLLEATLGVRLFDRTGRGVMLTPDGVEYAQAIGKSIRRLGAATTDIKSRGKKGGPPKVVRIRVPQSFAQYWLIPHLADLAARLPDVDLRVNAHPGHPQDERAEPKPSVDAPADVQIVYGKADVWKDQASLLIDEVFQPYCAPAFRDRHRIDSPDRLPLAMLISTAQNAVSWDDWLHYHGVDPGDRTVRTIGIDLPHLAIEAASEGFGVVLESSALVAKKISDGALVPLFAERTCPGAAYWIYTSSRRPRPEAEAIKHWLTAVFTSGGLGSGLA